MADTFDPIVIQLGKVRKKSIKALKRGNGKLIAEVEQAIQDIRERGGADSAGKEYVPLVLIYKEKTKRRKRRGLFGF